MSEDDTITDADVEEMIIDTLLAGAIAVWDGECDGPWCTCVVPVSMWRRFLKLCLEADQ